MKIVLQQRYDIAGFGLHIFSDDGSKYATLNEKGNLIYKDHEENVSSPPIIHFGWNDPGFPDAMMKALLEFGTKPTDQGFVEGELTATKKHLEDMRKLALKLKK